MARKDRGTLAERIASAAEAALVAQDYVCCIDVMERIGWLCPEAAKDWRVRRFACLEDAVQSNPARILEAMRLFQAWAEAKGLIANETQYLARSPQRETLRFSRSGDAAIERMSGPIGFHPRCPKRSANTWLKRPAVHRTSSSSSH
jgi:hypothetical protein